MYVWFVFVCLSMYIFAQVLYIDLHVFAYKYTYIFMNLYICEKFMLEWIYANIFLCERMYMYVLTL